MGLLRAFGAFWYDFLIGDRPELFIGSIVVLAAAWAAIQAGFDPAAAGIGLALLVVALGGLSVWLAVRRRPGPTVDRAARPPSDEPARQ